MHYFLLGSLVMALIYLSAEGNIHVFQYPRFIAVKTGRSVWINCFLSNKSLPTHVEWFKGQNYKDQLKSSHRIKIMEKSDNRSAFITILETETEDSGTYFCKLNGMPGPGTELLVYRHLKPPNLMITRVKDFVIFLQALLLILCIVVPLVQFYRMEKKEDAVYEEPEDNHIYEGLAVEQCGGADLYEDISVFAQVPDAPWEIEYGNQDEEDVIRHAAAQINTTKTSEVCHKIKKLPKTGIPVNP
uniref:CD79b molecule, immunoglobulin-associated beta n=1 Tax=Cyprinus carpio carpio TaxID=630221 RepID=A0A8C1E0Y2_CYPCA